MKNAFWQLEEIDIKYSVNAVYFNNFEKNLTDEIRS